MTYIITFLIGGIIGYLISRALSKKEVALEKQLYLESKKNVEELEDKFKSIATDVLRNNSQDFSRLMKSDLDSTKAVMSTELSNKEKNFERLVEGVNKSVEAVKEKVVQIEKERSEQIGSLKEGVKSILETGGKMVDTAIDLKTALSSNSAIRGRWGEAVLKNLLEESGLTEGEDFFVQEEILGNEGAALRPDITIKFPGDFRLAVDSKASLDEFIKSIEEKNPDEKKQHIEKFVAHLRGRVRDLASKEYQKYIDPKIPYVVMFIPGENAVRAAFECEPDFYREAQNKKVMLASPATIMPLILLIAHAWKQHRSSENAIRLNQEVSELGDRLGVFFGHVNEIGSSLSAATKRFNSAVGSWDSKVFPKIDKIKMLGGNIDIERDEIQAVDEAPRISKKLAFPKETDNRTLL